MINKDTLDRPQILALVDKFIHHRYAHKGNSRDSRKYKEMSIKLIKGDDVALDIDAVDPN